jgi:hypothetical protein
VLSSIFIISLLAYVLELSVFAPELVTVKHCTATPFTTNMILEGLMIGEPVKVQVIAPVNALCVPTTVVPPGVSGKGGVAENPEMPDTPVSVTPAIVLVICTVFELQESPVSLIIAPVALSKL